MDTLRQALDNNRSAIRSQISLSRMVGKAQFEQLRICSQTQLAGVINHYEVQLHHKSPLYGVQKHGTLMARWRAKRMHLSY